MSLRPRGATVKTRAYREQRAAALKALLHFAPSPTSLPITIDSAVVTDLIHARTIIRAGIDAETRRAAYRLRSEAAALAILDGDGVNLFSSCN